MRVKEFLRWLVRRDADSNATLFGGWVQDVGTILAVIIGVNNGLLSGLLFYAAMKIGKILAGWADLHYGVTKYRNHYISARVPMNVKVLKNRRSSP